MVGREGGGGGGGGEQTVVWIDRWRCGGRYGGVEVWMDGWMEVWSCGVVCLGVALCLSLLCLSPCWFG